MLVSPAIIPPIRLLVSESRQPLTLSMVSMPHGAQNLIVVSIIIRLATCRAGYMFTLVGMISFALVMPASALADRFGRKRTLVPSGYLECAGLAIVAASRKLRSSEDLDLDFNSDP